MNQGKQMKVAEVMEADFLVMDGLSTVAEALTRLKERNAHFLLVDKRDDDDEYGIVLVSDIAKQVLAQNRAPARVNVYEIMTKPVLTVRPEMDIRYCARMFEHFGVSTAPVIKSGSIRGVVTYDALVLKGLAADL